MAVISKLRCLHFAERVADSAKLHKHFDSQLQSSSKICQMQRQLCNSLAINWNGVCCKSAEICGLRKNKNILN